MHSPKDTFRCSYIGLSEGSVCHWDLSFQDLLAVDFVLRKQRKQELLYISRSFLQFISYFWVHSVLSLILTLCVWAGEFLFPIACPQALPTSEQEGNLIKWNDPVLKVFSPSLAWDLRSLLMIPLLFLGSLRMSHLDLQASLHILHHWGFTVLANHFP